MLLPLILSLSFVPTAVPVQDVTPLVRELSERRDEADPALIERLAEVRTREAADALVAAYDAMSSVLMRREILLVLPVFDAVPGASQVALQRLSDSATAEPEPELREAAVDALAGCPVDGPEFLRRIVDSSAHDDVRLRAMRRLVELVPASEVDWFRELYQRPPQENDREVRKALRSGERVERITALTELRELAFERLAPSLETGDLLAAAREKERDAADLPKEGIRRLALLELERRGERRLGKLAAQVFSDRTETAANRSLAARLVAADQGRKALPRLCDEGLKDPSVTPMQLRLTLAELVAQLRGPKEEKKLAKQLEKGRPHEQVFALRALHGCAEPGLLELVEQLLADGLERPAARAAIAFLGVSGAESARVALETQLRDGEDPVLAAEALAALSQLRGAEAEWARELEQLARSPDRRLRNAALTELVRLDARAHQPLLVEALSSPDWTTRKVALEGLEAARTRDAVGALVDRIGAEEGRMLHLFADVLWRLTGQPFHTRTAAWRAWWAQEGERFEPIESEALALLERQQERSRLAQTTRAASFFGLRVESRRVVFVIDVSGSMEERLATPWLGEQGPTRLAFVKEELTRVVDTIEPGTFFDLVTFSGGVTRWAEGGRSVSDPAARADAKVFVERLRAGGGTNLYGALAEAFGDLEVDTVFVLSDGEPSGGRVTDSWGIRRAVREWNEGRGVVVHAVAVGGRLPILEWLALDSGGSFTQIR